MGLDNISLTSDDLLSIGHLEEKLQLNAIENVVCRIVTILFRPMLKIEQGDLSHLLRN